MKPTEQQNNDARAENTDDRNLTPRQIQKRKKMMIFPLSSGILRLYVVDFRPFQTAGTVCGRIQHGVADT